jgi:alkaline phosphatase D
MKASPANWKVWGTELMVMSLRIAFGTPAQLDAWDAYAHEREQILDYLIDNNVKNIVAITGDIHTFFAGTAYTKGDKAAPGSRAAFPEFVGGSATSTGIPEATGLSDDTLKILAGGNPHIDFYDFHKKGYGLMRLKKSEVTCDLKAVDALTKGAWRPTVISRHTVTPGNPIAQKVI